MSILEPLDARIKATDELIDETVIAKYHIDKAMLHCIKSSNNKPCIMAFRESFEKPKE